MPMDKPHDDDDDDDDDDGQSHVYHVIWQMYSFVVFQEKEC